MKKGVWFSELKKMSPLTIRLLGTPQKGDRGYYCYFEAEDGSERYVQIGQKENNLRRDLAALPKKEWITVEATGWEESARLRLKDVDGAGPRDEPEESAGSVAADLYRGLLTGADVVARFRDEFGREPTTAEYKVGLSAAIEMARSRGRKTLSKGEPGEYAKEAAEPRYEPEPEPEPRYEPETDTDLPF